MYQSIAAGEALPNIANVARIGKGGRKNLCD
jgi:hypothetical protein